MDKEYIKMCREATEIQELWEPKPGDKYMNLIDIEEGNYPLVIPWCELEKNCICYKEDKFKDSTWILSQEDLQEIMFNISKKGSIGILEEFIRWYQKGLPLFFDINKLWLCFVMETCYSKRWNGETWEKID